jgi:hypothetical protein
MFALDVHANAVERDDRSRHQTFPTRLVENSRPRFEHRDVEARARCFDGCVEPDRTAAGDQKIAATRHTEFPPAAIRLRT